jgi:rhamnulokinase
MSAHAAVDLGAQSGRVAVGLFDGERLDIEVVHRFATGPSEQGGRLRWDAWRSYGEICDGLKAAAAAADVVSVGVDSWALDFGLIDREGNLIELPVHYRDARRAHEYESVIARIGKRDLYERTGIQLMPINTIFELAAMAADRDSALTRADQLLLLPDLIHYWLCGSRTTEYTNATTTQCLDLSTQDWAVDLLDRLEIPSRLLPDVVQPPTLLGSVSDERSGLRGAAVFAGATHDTAAAVVGAPLSGRNAAFLSVGTWSLVGIESDDPILGDEAYEANITNEGGVDGTVRVLRNVAGLWLLEECRRTWAARGSDRSLDELFAAADGAPRLHSFIDPNDPMFVEPGDMPARIARFCELTGQQPPESEGAVVRCILESLALKHAATVDMLAAVSGRNIEELNILGGGSKIERLCEWTASASCRPVHAGPVEATIAGNLLVQALGLGEIGSLEEARAISRSSFTPSIYEPADDPAWRDARERFATVTTTASEALI